MSHDGQHPIVIIGAGPAGLTAGLELVRQSPSRPLILESLDQVGGISRTINYRGNRMDIGGHRFFSKSDWVMQWWQELLPFRALEKGLPEEHALACMLVRSRLSRIYFMSKFFDYPLSINAKTIRQLGWGRLIRIGWEYAKASMFPIRPEKNLEDFYINRFGGELYRTFFKDYTEKVWGVGCQDISPDWGAQRIKSLSIRQAVWHAIQGLFSWNKDIRQKKVATSLIERFLYPALGPGQLWQQVADQITAAGGELRYGKRVEKIFLENGRVTGVATRDAHGGQLEHLACDHLISSMPVRDLIMGMGEAVPATIREAASGLVYRDFITIGLLVRRMKRQPGNPVAHPLNLLPDTWIYIQEPNVRIGRLQIFNNWSPLLVKDGEHTVWLGAEYFCNEGDDLWNMSDEALGQLAAGELAAIQLIDQEDVLDFHVVRIEKAYPAYFGSFHRMPEIREYLDKIPNLHLIGRNGMHRYNNQDHSMLTARYTVENILTGNTDRKKVWDVNPEDEYLESK
ncbi:MAG: NAD(P)/FAD-dependent oxidoreductase [Magnetococcales bacterium]|nr:NAD(P)/FAD-dependent oxidoreductase [Magnetococcales bacterium]NGZ07304.1 NAD(P)/FAD-dependent oxidoreductase [Magnetococcales bacterium]